MSISLLAGFLLSIGAAGQPLLSPEDAHAAMPVAKPSKAVVASMLGTEDPYETRRLEIFHVLRGGDAALSEDVNAHLWKLATSLAATNWTMPRVHIQVVVRKTNG
jgi:hypothetical protein